MDQLTFLSQFQKAEKISAGMAGDEKYYCLQDEKAYLLRIADGSTYETKKAEYENLRKLNEAGLPVPQCVDLVKSDDDSKVFTLLSWIPGTEVEKVLPQMNCQEQYKLGLQAGEILGKIHEATPVTDASTGWYDRYFEVLAPRLNAYREKGINFEGAEAILDFIEENKYLLKTRSQCHHHGDYHIGNLIVRDGKVWVIDWHMVDFDGVGDPWYEFNRLNLEHPAFAQGQIDGYFQNQVPEEFWRLFALYVATSAITSIVWAKYRAPEALDWVMARNRDVVKMFDWMQNPVPLWYRRKSEDRQ